MTSEEERFHEFLDRCVTGDGSGSPTGATRIDDPAERRQEASRSRNLSEYHADAAQDNLEGRAPLMAIREGYYVMLHKANEALAFAGFKPRTHECTLLGLRGVFNAPGLADLLRRASEERLNVDYYINPDDPELAEFAGPEAFVENTVDRFVDWVDALIEEEGLE